MTRLVAAFLCGLLSGAAIGVLAGALIAAHYGLLT